MGDSIGGSHISSLNLAANLDKEKFKVKIVLHNLGVLSEYLIKKNIGFELLELKDVAGRKKNIFLQMISLFRNIPTLIKFISHEKIDIVHTQDARMHITWSIPAKIAGVAHIWHQRTVWSAGRLANFLVRFSSQVIVISEFVKRSLPNSIKDKSVIVWNPIEQVYKSSLVLENKNAIIKRFKCNANNKLVVTVGNLIAVKQPMLFIESALLLLKLSNENITFLVVGDDRENFYPQMKARIAEQGMEKQFHFMGFRDDAIDIISAADLLIATSRADAFGRTLVEAMSVGVPVIAVDAGGHSEIIVDGKTGYLVPDNSPSAIANIANELFENNTIRDKIIKNALLYAKSFSPSIHVKNISQIYNQELSL